MNDVTEIILKYRDLVRALWNNYFIPRQKDSDSFAWDVDVYFENIKQELFKALVSTKVFDKELSYSSKAPLIPIEVRPNLPPKGDYTAMYVIEEEGNNTTWDMISIKSEANKFYYLDFFDWTEDVMDCQFIRVRLVESEELTDLVGKDFLLDAWNVKYIKSSS